MTIREKEHLFPAIETICEWCKGHECGEGCEFYIDLFICSENDDSERFVGKHCLFDSCPSAWIREFEKLEQLDSSDIEAAYQRGLDDAWKCIEKICAEVIDGGLDSNTLKQIFGTAIIVNIFKTNSASEAIAKLKEYEEKQTEEKTDKSNLCADCETCRFADLTAYEFPCSVCSASHTFRWEARKGASE